MANTDPCWNVNANPRVMSQEHIVYGDDLLAGMGSTRVRFNLYMITAYSMLDRCELGPPTPPQCQR